MDNNTRPGYSEVGNAETGACVDGAGIMDNNWPGEPEGKVDIIVREKQTDANSEIYYAMHPSENKISTTPDKTNKIHILISF